MYLVRVCPSRGMIGRAPVNYLYGLVDDRLGGDRAHGLIELYGNQAAADEGLRRVLRDEPTWAGFVRVAEFPLIEVPVVEPR
jgi:hypothetical protein